MKKNMFWRFHLLTIDQQQILVAAYDPVQSAMWLHVQQSNMK